MDQRIHPDPTTVRGPHPVIPGAAQRLAVRQLNGHNRGVPTRQYRSDDRLPSLASPYPVADPDPFDRDIPTLGHDLRARY